MEICNITKRYGKVTALNNISLSIPKGLFGLIGRNGAGKTTLLRILATTLKPDEGEVKYGGINIYNNLEKYRTALGYLPQSTKLVPQLDIDDFLKYSCNLKGIEKINQTSEIENVKELVGLNKERKKKLSSYSGGMLRRAGIAQALLGDPEILIIDEPTTGLDPEERIYFLGIISKLAQNRTVILSTHIISDIENLCSKIGILDKGEIIYSGNKEKLIQNILNKLYEVTADDKLIELLKSEHIVTSIKYVEGNAIVHYVTDKPIINSIQIHPSLEDAYVYSLGGYER